MKKESEKCGSISPLRNNVFPRTDACRNEKIAAGEKRRRFQGHPPIRCASAAVVQHRADELRSPRHAGSFCRRADLSCIGDAITADGDADAPTPLRSYRRPNLAGKIRPLCSTGELCLACILARKAGCSPNRKHQRRGRGRRTAATPGDGNEQQLVAAAHPSRRRPAARCGPRAHLSRRRVGARHGPHVAIPGC
jgi:hypothetical protein